MPRHARLDIPGVLQHVIVRGIEKRRIFLDNKDRWLFFDRFSNLLLETNTDCLAWALLSNHIHLLLRPNTFKLSTFMRRLLTGYAVTFNLRHQRSGHLFQNRYKSIICEEEPYLLELVRYIHLNPLRAGLVATIDTLDRYRWSGHAVLMGKYALPGQNTNEVLLRFNSTLSVAQASYKAFVAGGISRGKRDDLVGGGLQRSLQSNNINEINTFDERILGTGSFVEKIKRHDKASGLRRTMSLDDIIREVASFYGTDSEHLKQRTKKKFIADARCLIAYIAVRQMGHNGQKVAERLNITRSGVSVAAQRAKGLLDRDSSLRDFINKLTS